MGSFLLSGVTVVHVVTRLDQGGAAEVILELTKTLSSDGMSVVLIVGQTDNPQTDLEKYCKKTGIELYRLSQLKRAVSPIHDFAAFLKIRKIIRRINPEIVHTHYECY